MKSEQLFTILQVNNCLLITGFIMEKTKDRILSAALELYVRNGYEKSTMRELAAALGITAGALYRHYRS